MIQTVILALLLQGAGPKKLQVAADAPLKPALVVPAGTRLPVAMVNPVSVSEVTKIGSRAK